MRALIEKIHAKPKRYRMRVALSGAALATSFIFLVWASTLGARLESGDLSASNNESAVAAVPFATDEFSAQLDTIKGTLNLFRGAEPQREGQTPLMQGEEGF